MNNYQLILDDDMEILPGEEVVVGEDGLEWDEGQKAAEERKLKNPYDCLEMEIEKTVRELEMEKKKEKEAEKDQLKEEEEAVESGEGSNKESEEQAYWDAKVETVVDGGNSRCSSRIQNGGGDSAEDAEDAEDGAAEHSDGSGTPTLIVDEVQKELEGEKHEDVELQDQKEDEQMEDDDYIDVVTIDDDIKHEEAGETSTPTVDNEASKESGGVKHLKVGEVEQSGDCDSRIQNGDGDCADVGEDAEDVKKEEAGETSGSRTSTVVNEVDHESRGEKPDDIGIQDQKEDEETEDDDFIDVVTIDDDIESGEAGETSTPTVDNEENKESRIQIDGPDFADVEEEAEDVENREAGEADGSETSTPSGDEEVEKESGAEKSEGFKIQNAKEDSRIQIDGEDSIDAEEEAENIENGEAGETGGSKTPILSDVNEVEGENDVQLQNDQLQNDSKIPISNGDSRCTSRAPTSSNGSIGHEGEHDHTDGSIHRSMSSSSESSTSIYEDSAQEDEPEAKEAPEDSDNRELEDARASSSSSQQKRAPSGFLADIVSKVTAIHADEIQSVLRNTEKLSTRKFLEDMEKKNQIRMGFFSALLELDPANFERNVQKSSALFTCCPSDVCERAVEEILRELGKGKKGTSNAMSLASASNFEESDHRHAAIDFEPEAQEPDHHASSSDAPQPEKIKRKRRHADAKLLDRDPTYHHDDTRNLVEGYRPSKFEGAKKIDNLKVDDDEVPERKKKHRRIGRSGLKNSLGLRKKQHKDALSRPRIGGRFTKKSEQVDDGMDTKKNTKKLVQVNDGMDDVDDVEDGNMDELPSGASEVGAHEAFEDREFDVGGLEVEALVDRAVGNGEIDIGIEAAQVGAPQIEDLDLGGIYDDALQVGAAHARQVRAPRVRPGPLPTDPSASVRISQPRYRRADAQMLFARETGQFELLVGKRPRTVENYGDGDDADDDYNEPESPKRKKRRYRKNRYQLKAGKNKNKEKRAKKRTTRVADPAYNYTCRMPRLAVDAKEFPLLPIEGRGYPGYLMGELREVFSDERAPEVPEDYDD